MPMKGMKVAALAALGGWVFQFCGCLSCFPCGGGDSCWGKILWDGALDIAWEALLDYDTVYDLWAD
jgi:hypothetical protein